MKKTKVGQVHIVAGCLHFPFVNKPLFNALCALIRDLKPVLGGVHLPGDIQDIHSLSRHDKGMVAIPGLTLAAEYRESNKLFDQLDAAIGTAKVWKTYIWGNHEDRYRRAMKDVDVSKYGKALLSPTEGCRLIERGYEVQEDYDNGFITLGNHLDVIHGQYISANASKKHLDVYKRSVMFAHTHRVGQHYDVNMASFNIGWLGDANAKVFGYASRITKMQWQNGFAVVMIDEDGHFHTSQINWVNNRFYFNGKCYKG